jgi:hypothetical protein
VVRWLVVHARRLHREERLENRETNWWGEAKVETKHTDSQGDDLLPTTDWKDEGQVVRRGRAHTGKHIRRGKKERKKKEKKWKKKNEKNEKNRKREKTTNQTKKRLQ